MSVSTAAWTSSTNTKTASAATSWSATRAGSASSLSLTRCARAAGCLRQSVSLRSALLYDVTSTYFEGNPKARRGYSRDQRSDCKQVNISLVCTPEGLPIAYEVFTGNTADVSSVEEMVEMMEAKYGRAKRILVMD